MNRPSRIGAIYRKELISILRDRRTMLAMIAIPVVLYPVLMLGFVRAMESDQVWLRAQQLVIETDNPAAVRQLEGIIAQAADPSKESQTSFTIQVGTTPRTQLGDQVQAHVTLRSMPRPDPFPPQIRVELDYNEINPRSRTAMEQLSAVLNRYGNRLTRASLERMLGSDQGNRSPGGSLVDLVLQPVAIHTVSSATEEQRGGWALGLIVPVILVLMTITGAVYPAIDVTAGERERGTLEALLATPVPVLDLTIAKFLVVASIGLFAAVINVASVGATMHFGGLTRVVSQELPVRFPASTLPIILLCMIPFALLSSAVLVAACSFARSFKEAQNYIMPIIIVALIPAVGAALPSARLRGIMMVMPVGNMVLLTRELFQATCTWTQILVVLLSTTLYAMAAVAVAARLFGQEAVLFADAGSWKTMFKRRFFRPAATPTASQALMLAALLFPATFYANSVLGTGLSEGFLRTMLWLTAAQWVGLFVLLPVCVSLYLKIDLARTFQLRRPAGRAWLAALLIGASSWVLANEFFALQARYVIAPSQALRLFSEQVGPQLAAWPLWLVVLLLAVVPATCEELLFRGFMLSGAAHGLGKWSAILTVAVIFGIFHFLIDRMPVTALMGVVLGYLCWQCRSIGPGIVVHVMHNACATVLGRFESVAGWLGLSGMDESAGGHLPLRVVIPALLVFALGLGIAASIRTNKLAADI